MIFAHSLSLILGDKRLIRYKDNGQERIVVAGSDSNDGVRGDLGGWVDLVHK